MELTAAERAFLQSQLLEHSTILNGELLSLCPRTSPSAYDAALRQKMLVRGLLAKLGQAGECGC